MYIKVINMNFNGQIDYKGLNINKFKAGTQVYDFENNVFLVNTNEEVTTTSDILVITEEEYTHGKEEILSREIPAESADLEERVNTIEATLNALVGE